MRSIELVFDDSTDSAIRADWSRLAAAGIPSLAGHTSPSNSPHITLATGSDLPVAGHARLWEELPLDVELPGVQVFAAGSGKYVLARSVLMTAALFGLHRSLHEGLPEALPLTRPDAWTPHVTLGRRVPAALMGTAMDLLELRLQGRCTGARMWDSEARTSTRLA